MDQVEGDSHVCPALRVRQIHRIVTLLLSLLQQGIVHQQDIQPGHGQLAGHGLEVDHLQVADVFADHFVDVRQLVPLSVHLPIVRVALERHALAVVAHRIPWIHDRQVHFLCTVVHVVQIADARLPVVVAGSLRLFIRLGVVLGVELGEVVFARIWPLGCSRPVDNRECRVRDGEVKPNRVVIHLRVRYWIGAGLPDGAKTR